jgi:hypothetical protein
LCSRIRFDGYVAGIDQLNVIARFVSIKPWGHEKNFHILINQGLRQAKARGPQAAGDVRWEFPSKHEYFHKHQRTINAMIDGKL